MKVQWQVTSTVTDIEPSLARDGMDADSLYEVIVNQIQKEDPELFAVHTERFLKAPHILVPLLSHLASLSAEDNLKFPLQLRRLSDLFVPTIRAALASGFH